MLALALATLQPLPTLSEAPKAGAIDAPATVGSIQPEKGAVSPRSEQISVEASRTRAELDALGSTIQLNADTIRHLDAEVAELGADRERIRKAMIDAAAAQKAAGADIEVAETKLVSLRGEEADAKRALRRRRGVLAEVLASLQRMGRTPPPALLVEPEDALASVRSAILLGAVVPRIRAESDKLAAVLSRLTALRTGIEAEKARFSAARARQREEEARLARLFAEKERLEAGSRDHLEAERKRAAELAGRATSLQDLIASLEAERGAAREAEEAARALADENAAATRRADAFEAVRLRIQAERARAADGETVVAALPPAAPPEATPPEAAVPQFDIDSLRRDMARIGPDAAFSTLKGTLSPPVAGPLRTHFGESDGVGRTMTGATFGARSGDVVTAPADGVVLYSGPFRSYGQLLILDAGDGYHVVLAGMSRIDAAVGQSVLAGEPVAVMGALRLASVSGAAVEPAEPSLYVEFRKDGNPVDPAPWWADGSSGRTRNDS